MIELKPNDSAMVAMQLITDEGAFVCNIKTNDVAKIAAGESGVFIVMHCAIRLDAMFEGQYEIYRARTIETSSVDSYRPFEKSRGTVQIKRVTKRTSIAYAIKGTHE